jgi:ABC-type dipeptide/oligopeptide/nickel transport system ATPase component
MRDVLGSTTARLMPPRPEVVGLSTEFHLRSGVVVRAVQDVSFSVNAGETLAIGGSPAVARPSPRSLIRLIPEPPACIVAGNVEAGGRRSVDADQRQCAACEDARSP